MNLHRPKEATAGQDSLPYLQTFSKAAELLSFTGSAKSLGLTQAAVSQRIQALEKALDLSLFQRMGGRLTLTEAGRKLYDYAQRILALHREARHVLTGQKSEAVGELVLGASTIPCEHLLPTLLPLFQRKHPQIHVRVEVGDSTAIIGLVERGKVHLGLVDRKTQSPFLEFNPLAKDRPVVVVPPEHPLGRRREISFQQLCKQPLVL